jgi:L-ascorbate metabolism protein UlaG (beta-lactamase superfamily)
MDAKRAADLINIIVPEYAIPTHYGTVAGKPGDAKTFAKYVKEPVKVVEKIKF